MKTLLLLLSKDLRRVVRNPIPVLIFILIPLFITAMIGFTFGGAGSEDENSGPAPLRLGIVDHEDGLFSRMIKGSVNQEDFKRRIDAHFLDESEALGLLGKGSLSAVLIIPERFSEDFMYGDEPVALTLVKNPAESIYPTLAQEGLEIVVAFLNALARNMREDLREVYGMIESEREFDFLRDGIILLDLGMRMFDRMEAVRGYLVPPVISYERIKNDAEVTEEESGEDAFSVFAYILAGMFAMFLLMQADNCMRDLYREARLRTLERFRIARGPVLPLVVGKVVFAFMVLSIVAVILLGGGALAFGFRWQNPLSIVLVVASYCLFAAGWTGFISALAGKERRADILNNLFAVGMSVLGGAMWPATQLPEVIQRWVTPYMPTHWVTESLRGLQGMTTGVDWMQSSLILFALGVGMIWVSACIYNFRLERGIKE
jgi:ABC-2 type transport system permease protein